ncbi:MAG: ribosomal RNA small subunit methyltransferase A [Methanobacteriota archaeon]|nr:MAG: ribosomal RNA small subunit methyltransferase A [Euryarchaeota archaeon]
MGKRLGQHFLINDGAARKIAGEAYGSCLEIGGGRGALTKHLYTRVEKLYIIELDKELAAKLKEKFPQAEVIEKDFLDVEPFKVDVIVGNLPYYISSAIVFRLYDWDFEKAVVMLQKEFVEKMLAKAGTKSYGRLSVNSQDSYHIEKLFCLKASSFRPAPKVESCVIRLEKKKRRLEGCEELIRRLFSQKNKKVRNIVESPSSIGEKRPWQLSIEEIRELCKKSDGPLL